MSPAATVATTGPGSSHPFVHSIKFAKEYMEEFTGSSANLSDINERLCVVAAAAGGGGVDYGSGSGSGSGGGSSSSSSSGGGGGGDECSKATTPAVASQGDSAYAVDDSSVMIDGDDFNCSVIKF